jgi:hypothetical protein
VLTPAGLGAPGAVFVKSQSPVGEVTLTYRRPHRLVVTEFRGAADPDYAGKIAGRGTSVKRLRIDGSRAIWISGAPHFFFYRSPDGTQRFETMRLAGNVLLLERGPLLIRLEGPRSETEAVALAKSLR